MRTVTRLVTAVCLVCLWRSAAMAEDSWVVLEGKEGPGTGKHIVLIAGDDEYRSEELIPQLGKLRDEVLFGDVWEQPELTKRDRSLVTVAVLTALYRTDEMRGHMKRALDNGVTQDELRGLITHIAFYAGWPCAVNAGRVALEVFEDD